MLLLLMLTFAALGAEPRKAIPLDVTGDTVVVIRSFAKPCAVTAPPGADFYLWSYPDAVKADATDNVLTVTSAPKGTYKVSVVSITFIYDEAKKKWNKVKDAGTTTLVVGGSDPDPIDPPTDAYTKSVQVAYSADPSTTKATDKAVLTEMYRGAALLLAGTATAKQLHDKLKATRQSLIDERLATTRTALDVALNDLGADPSAPVDDTMKAKARAAFAKMTAALEGVK